MKAAKACVRAWTWLYTQGLPPVERAARRNEIESDLWEFAHDCDQDSGIRQSLILARRFLAGIPDDILWRWEYQVVPDPSYAPATPRFHRHPAITASALTCSLTIHLLAAGAVIWLSSLPSRGTNLRAHAGIRQPFDVARGRPLDVARGRPVASISGARVPTSGSPSETGVRRHANELAVHTEIEAIMKRVFAATTTLMLVASGAIAQTPQSVSGPAFEVASVRPNSSGHVGMRLEPQSGDRLIGTNVTAAMLIRFAYDLPDFQVSGGPGWLNSDRFDVAAKAEANATIDQRRLMLRHLLTERFRLNVHVETRDLPIYTLIMARTDGRLGAQLRRTTADCAATDSLLEGIGPSPAGGPPPCGFFGFGPGTQFSAGRGGLAFRGLTMAALAKVLVPILRRSVRDNTGLTGYFDGDFDFVAEVPLPPPPPGMPNPFVEPFASVFAVLPDQLGLKLESTRGPVDILIIDSVERPKPE